MTGRRRKSSPGRASHEAREEFIHLIALGRWAEALHCAEGQSFRLDVKECEALLARALDRKPPLDLVKLMLDRGASATAQHIKNTSPAYLAASHGQQDVVELLAAHGVQLDRELLEAAAKQAFQLGNPGTAIRTLIAAGANPNVTDSPSPNTPLHYTDTGDYFANYEAMTALLDCGARVDIRNEHGETYLDLFQKCMRRRPPPGVTKTVVTRVQAERDLVKEALERIVQKRLDSLAADIPPTGNKRHHGPKL